MSRLSETGIHEYHHLYIGDHFAYFWSNERLNPAAVEKLPSWTSHCLPRTPCSVCDVLWLPRWAALIKISCPGWGVLGGVSWVGCPGWGVLGGVSWVGGPEWGVLGGESWVGCPGWGVLGGVSCGVSWVGCLGWGVLDGCPGWGSWVGCPGPEIMSQRCHV